MDTFENIVRSRRLVKIGVGLGYAGAVAVAALRIANTDPATVGETLGSLALGAAAATPSTLALLSLDRRPSLLPAATVAQVAVGLLAYVLLPLWIVVGVLWHRAWRGRVVRADVSKARAAARVGMGALVAASILVLFVHVDPVCTQTLNDGSVQSIDPATRGLQSGWTFSTGNSTVATSSLGAEIAEERCSSNSIVVGEALASLVIIAATIELGRRWPRGVTTSGETPSSDDALTSSSRGGA